MDLFELSKEEAKKIKQVPGSLEKVLGQRWSATTTSCCAETCSPRTSIETWIDYKRLKENDAIRLQSSPLRVLPVLRLLRRSDQTIYFLIFL